MPSKYDTSTAKLECYSSTGGSYVPVIREKNGRFSILRRPVTFTEKTEVLGGQGDVVLFDFKQHVVGLRKGMRNDLSQHVCFTKDQEARPIERLHGHPLWYEALALQDGDTEV